MKEKHTEFIKFRVFSMPCCGQMLCWVNPRIPTHCPECGESVLSRLKFHAMDYTLVQDDEAQLKYSA